MNISKRLSRLAAMVTEGSRLADVGTDHGYVPLCLYRQGRIPSAIAMDINEGPLERARAHIREAGLEHYIETRLSDGLHALRAGEADTVLIAGMGGGLTERILTDGKGVLETVRELVLQPQSEIWRVRRFLCENGWRIVCEDIVLDEGKYYPIFRAVKGQAEPYGPGELLYGKSASVPRRSCWNFWGNVFRTRGRSREGWGARRWSQRIQGSGDAGKSWRRKSVFWSRCFRSMSPTKGRNRVPARKKEEGSAI